MEKKKISFDYDDTLSFKQVEKVTKTLKGKYDIYIVTSRPKTFQNTLYNNKDIESAAKRLNATIIYMGYKPKWDYFKDKEFLFHLDDNELEIKLINLKTSTKGVLFTGKESLELITKIIEDDSK